MCSARSVLVARAIILGLVVLAGCSNRTAQDVAVLDYGIYDATLVTKGNPALGVPLEVVAVSGVRHRETTDTIPCAAGIFFGLRLDPATLPSRFDLKTEFEHPPFSAAVSDSQETISVSEYQGITSSEHEGAIWYFLEEAEHELVPGIWVIRAFVNQQLVAEKQFSVSR
jgi:hypothetical protein